VNTGQPPTATADDLLDEVRLAWLEVLDVDDVSADANFLEVGGDSILLLQLWERLNELTSRNLKAADLFRHSTIRAQAELLATPEGEPRLVVLGGHSRSQLLGRARREQPAGPEA
jgi:aryl carrier-like protein